MNWARASRSTTLKKKTNSSLVDSTYNIAKFNKMPLYPARKDKDTFS